MQPITIQISLNLNQEFWFWACIICLILWLLTVISLLKRQDMKEVDKIVWVIVLCALNILGATLYWFLAPGKESLSRARTEKELKDYFNSRTDKPGQ